MYDIVFVSLHKRYMHHAWNIPATHETHTHSLQNMHSINVNLTFFKVNLNLDWATPAWWSTFLWCPKDTYLWGSCGLEVQTSASNYVSWLLRCSDHKVVSLATEVILFRELLPSVLWSSYRKSKQNQLIHKKVRKALRL